MIDIKAIDNKKLQDFLILQNDYVLKNTRLVTPESLGHDYLYHISYKKRDVFIPNVSKRGHEGEDNSFLRVHVGTDFLSCCLGHGAVLGDVLFPNPKYTKTTSLYLYGFKFDYAIRPSEETTPNSNKTKEHWLFVYDPEQPDIKPALMCEFIPVTATVVPGTSKKYRYTVTFAMRVEKGFKIKLDDNMMIDEGTWLFDVASGADFLNDSVLGNVRRSEKTKVSFESVPSHLNW